MPILRPDGAIWSELLNSIECTVHPLKKENSPWYCSECRVAIQQHAAVAKGYATRSVDVYYSILSL